MIRDVVTRPWSRIRCTNSMWFFSLITLACLLGCVPRYLTNVVGLTSFTAPTPLRSQVQSPPNPRRQAQVLPLRTLLKHFFLFECYPEFKTIPLGILSVLTWLGIGVIPNISIRTMLFN